MDTTNMKSQALDVRVPAPFSMQGPYGALNGEPLFHTLADCVQGHRELWQLEYRLTSVKDAPPEISDAAAVERIIRGEDVTAVARAAVKSRAAREANRVAAQLEHKARERASFLADEWLESDETQAALSKQFDIRLTRVLRPARDAALTLNGRRTLEELMLDLDGMTALLTIRRAAVELSMLLAVMQVVIAPTSRYNDVREGLAIGRWPYCWVFADYAIAWPNFERQEELEMIRPGETLELPAVTPPWVGLDAEGILWWILDHDVRLEPLTRSQYAKRLLQLDAAAADRRNALLAEMPTDRSEWDVTKANPITDPMPPHDTVDARPRDVWDDGRRL